MNYSALKILPGDDDYFHKTRSKFIKTDAFTVLPPFSPQIPGPPPTPNPYRVLPPIVSRKKPSFVILQEVGSRPASREPSPSGRVSPFRGCGFKPNSREQSPARQPRKDESCDSYHSSRSRSRLPVALQRKKNARRMSKSVSPVSHSNIPRPLNRHTSYSPNRLTQVLLQMDSNRQKIGARPKDATSREPHRSTSQRNLKDCATPRISTQNLRVQKPPIPPNAPKAANNHDKTIPTCHKSKPEHTSNRERTTKAKGAVMKPARQIPVSPVRAAKYEPALKNNKNSLEAEKRLPKSPIRSKTTSRINSPSRSVSKKSKENVSPCSKTTSPVRTKNANTIPKSSAGTVKMPLRTAAKAAKKPSSCAKLCDVSDKGTAPMDGVASSPATRTSESATLIVTQPSEERTEEDHKDDKSNTVRTIGRKALTTSNLLNAIKKNIAQDNKGDEKRELSHTDTSRSLPISICGTGMTDSAVTLIRTTTEPALAPVQPELITEIRSAINEVRGGEEAQLTKSDAPNSVVTNPIPPSVAETSRDIPSPEEEVKKKPITPSPSPQHSAHLKHVTAILEMKKARPNSDHDEKSSIRGEGDQLAVDTSIGATNTPATTTTTTMKNESEPLNVKNQSTEYLVQQYKNTVDWDNRFRRSKRGRTIDGHHPVRVSTISGASATTPASEYPQESCYKKYFCYFCYKCKLRKRDATMSTVNSKSPKCSSCTRHQNGFRNLFNTLRCSKKKNRVTLIDAKKDSTCPPPRERSGCTFCGGSAYKKCLSMLCCWNSAVCLGMRNTGNKLRSGCWNCLCCGVKKQTVISESERRRSTISNARKPRKWTRIFTDFPKLDSSFVEHASVMRGAIPVLPLPIAWICLILNVFLPGSGTFSSGVFCLCTGKARFSINDSLASRFGSFLVNLLVAGSQLFTVLFCLVGWGWSIWWGVIMLRMARKNKRIMLAEKVTHEPRPISVVTQNRDVERGTI